jgi:hypothetical protein
VVITQSRNPKGKAKEGKAGGAGAHRLHWGARNLLRTLEKAPASEGAESQRLPRQQHFHHQPNPPELCSESSSARHLLPTCSVWSFLGCSRTSSLLLISGSACLVLAIPPSREPHSALPDAASAASSTSCKPGSSEVGSWS